MPELPAIKNEAMTIESISRLIAGDQHLLIQQALEIGLPPPEVQTLVYEYRDQWDQLKLDEAMIKAFIRRYESAYREAEK